MKAWKHNLVPALFAFGGVVALVPTVLKSVITGKPLNVSFFVIGISFLCFAFVFFVGRRSNGSSGPPSA
jgi:hypothetical protein